jgi:hypothetical protein
VFDATPSTEFGADYNRIGIGLEDHTKEDTIGIFDSLPDLDFFEEYILYVYIMIVILLLLILGACYFSCVQV